MRENIGHIRVRSNVAQEGGRRPLKQTSPKGRTADLGGRGAGQRGPR